MVSRRFWLNLIARARRAKSVVWLAGDGKGPDRSGYRAEFVELVKKARQLAGK